MCLGFAQLCYLWANSFFRSLERKTIGLDISSKLREYQTLYKPYFNTNRMVDEIWLAFVYEDDDCYQSLTIDWWTEHFTIILEHIFKEWPEICFLFVIFLFFYFSFSLSFFFLENSNPTLRWISIFQSLNANIPRARREGLSIADIGETESSGTKRIVTQRGEARRGEAVSIETIRWDGGETKRWG